MKTHPPRIKNTTLSIAFTGVCILMFVHAFIAFSNRGAFGLETEYTRGGVLIISNILMVALILVHHKALRSPPWLLKLLIVWTLWMVIASIVLIPHGSHEFVKGLMEALYCPLFFICFFVFTWRSPAMTEKMIGVFFSLLIFVTLLYVFVFRFQYVQVRPIDYLALNDVYYVLLLLPWVMICRKLFWKNAGIIIIAGVVFWSFKRTALFALGLALISYFVVEGWSSRKRVKKKWVLSSIVVICGVFMLFYGVETRVGEIFLARISAIPEDKGSGRLIIFGSVLSAQGESSAEAWIFGHGHDGIRRERVHLVARTDGLQARSAHNDWMEVLFDYGLPGLVIYALIHLSIICNTKKLIRARSRYGAPMAVSYVIFFVMSMLSHLVLYPTYFSYMMAFWGMTCALQKKHRLIAAANKTTERSYAIGVR